MVKNKEISLPKALSLLTFNPSNILKLNLGTIEKNKDADICIFDLTKPWKVSPNEFYSKSKNSPFDGMLLEGKNLMTFVRGKLIYGY